MTDQLSQLKAMTTVVADTGDIEAITKFQPQDATTNPSLLLKAASLPNYQQLLTTAVDWAKTQSEVHTWFTDIIRSKSRDKVTSHHAVYE